MEYKDLYTSKLDIKKIVEKIAKKENISEEKAQDIFDMLYFKSTDLEAIKKEKEYLGNLYDQINWID